MLEGGQKFSGETEPKGNRFARDVPIQCFEAKVRFSEKTACREAVVLPAPKHLRILRNLLKPVRHVFQLKGCDCRVDPLPEMLRHSKAQGYVDPVRIPLLVLKIGELVADDAELSRCTSFLENHT